MKSPKIIDLPLKKRNSPKKEKRQKSFENVTEELLASQMAEFSLRQVLSKTANKLISDAIDEHLLLEFTFE